MEKDVVTEKKEKNKAVKAIILSVVVILTILAGIAIGYMLFNIMNPAA